MFRLSLLSALLLSLLNLGAYCLAAESDDGSPRFVYSHDHVLGTSLEIEVQTDLESAALEAESRILKEIGRLSAIFSTYDPDSEFSRWQRSSKSATPVSPELLEVLAASDRWRDLSGGAFQPGVEALSRVWSAAQKRDSLPSRNELQAAIALANQPHWWLDAAAKTATRLTECPLTLNAIAKGAIVEWACQAACESRDIRGLSINLGGDLRVYGDAVQEVAIADPRNDAVNAQPVARIFVTNRAVATSGGYRRGFRVGGKWHSHILNSRTGEPASEILSATVVADSSTDADALATICNVLPVSESLNLVHSLSRVECLLINRDGSQFKSRGWDELASPRLYRFAASPAQLVALAAADEPGGKKPAGEAAAEKGTAKAAAELHELVVKFELNRPAGTQYRRPYVAVWLEDEDEFPVKTAVLWMQTKTPGPRWHRDLLRWYRNDGVRKLADGSPLIGTISGATRGPGEYKAVFDGLDDAGKPLKPGKYTLYLEAAREHGTYQLIRHTLTLGSNPIKEASLKGNVEIKAASVEYGPRDAQPAENHGK